MEKKYLLHLFSILIGIQLSFAQLNPGDIAFIQYNADGTDNFAFVCLVDIPANEVIKFTDNEENDLTGGEGTITWTAPAGGISCGTIITITTTPTATIGMVTETNDVNFTGTGDGIIAYQGTTASPTFIAALGNDGATAGVYSGSKEGNLPTGLTLGVNAQSIAEIDNAIYNGSTLNDTKANILTAIYDAANWTGNDANNQTFSSVFTVTDCAACVEPTTDAVFHVNSPQNITTNSVRLNWTVGDGSKRIVVMSTSPIAFVPNDNTTYTSNTAYGTSTAVDTNTFVVYNGSANTVDVTNLIPGTLYYTKIYEYNCNTGSEDYYISGTPTTDTFYVNPENPSSFNKVCTTNTTINLEWSAPANGVFTNYLLIARENASPHSVNSIDPNTIVTDNLDFTLAGTFGATAPNSRFLYKGSNTSATITGLTQGVSYTFEVLCFSENGTIYRYSSGTTTSQIIQLGNVTSAVANGNNAQATINWSNPNNACFDEVLIVATTTNGITFSPSGDGTSYTANTVYAAPNQVVYLANGNNVTVTNLINGTTYYFEIFVRNGTTWSSGVEVSVTPNTQTIFNPGDLVIVGYDNKVGTLDDVVTVLTMVDINPNTTFWYTNATYEIGALPNVRTKEWKSCTVSPDAMIGSQELTYTGPDVLPAGSTFCITVGASQILGADIVVHQSSGNGTYNFSDGVVPLGFFDNVNISTSKPDSIFLMQGSWSGDLGGYRNFNGTVLGGIQDGGNWYTIADDLSNLSGNALRISRIPPDIQCFAIQGTGTPGKGFAYYNGTQNDSQINLLGEIADFATNWVQGVGDNANDIAGLSCDPAFIFTIVGVATPGVWTNAKNDNNWFNCGNWENLTVPSATTDVVINNISGSDFAKIDDNAIDADIYNKIATCNNLSIQGEKVVLESDVNDVLKIFGNLTITNGMLDMDDGDSNTNDGLVVVSGNWTNSNELNFLQGNGTIHFNGLNAQTILCNAGTQNEVFYNLILENNFTTADFNSDLIAENNLEVKTGKTLLIKQNHYAKITNNIINDGTITVENEASLVQVNNVSPDANSGAGTYAVHKTTTPYVMYDYTYWSSPIKTANIGTVFSANPAGFIYAFNPQNFSDEFGGNGYPQIIPGADTHDDNGDDWSVASGNMTLAKGYAIMGAGAIFPFTPPTATTSTQSVVFNGKVNNGLVEIPVFKDLYNTTNGSGNAFNKNDNLIGNPYPSAISAADFLTANPNLGGTIYFWTHDSVIGSGANVGPDAYNFTNDDYATWNTLGGTAAHIGSPVPDGTIASGQGFIVTATVNETIQFNNNMRVTQNTSFYRGNRVWVNLKNNAGLFRQILIGFNPNATDNLDRLYDGLRVENGTNYDFYSILNGTKLAIQGLAPLQLEKTIPLGVELVETGEFTIEIDNFEVELANTNIYLKDNLLHITHDLKLGSYSFTSQEIGNIDNRFELIFSRNTLNANSNNVVVAKLIVTNDTSVLVKTNTNAIIKEILIYDILGKRIFSEKTNSTQVEVHPKFTNGNVYIFKALLENGKILTKKHLTAIR